MHPLKRASLFLLAYCGIVGLSAAALAATGSAAPAAGSQDAQHAFDWEFGTWKTHVKRRLHPLSGSEAWAEYDGTSVISRIWGGKANLVELEVDGPQGHLELGSLRLYDPDTHQWSLNVASSRGGAGCNGQTDGQTGRQAGTIREPLDQRRDRRDIAEA